MAEHRWAPPEHQDVPIYAAESLPVDEIDEPAQLDSPESVWVSRLRFEEIGVVEQVKAFAVARSDVAVYVEIAWQGRLQRAWVPRATVNRRTLRPRRD
ncbi:hypothetical protein EDF51_106181 [Curtobacterium sp. PhB25]|uniref:hypothetical protein n=1 Tax=Curtobacterium sp. PhB25 TaxID=2485205 RepID=UPI001064D199|nr:hypothetical protein [Curtobacterium sp. PhB25]TDW69197.1 hypothetical protein EDF51_106181 [Curtobacterium sp. PhB25]